MQKSKDLNQIIASRRAMLMGGGAALAALAMPGTATAANTVSTFTDFDILNFALNLEYLEANFYYMAAFGTTIDKPNAASTAAGAPSAGIPIASSGGTAGVSPITTGATAVPFTLPAVKAYALETAVEEGNHVVFLQTAIKQFGGSYVGQPALDISPAGAFTTVANAANKNATGGATIGSAFFTSGLFNPYANDVNFLAGAYIFEDVGVTAYAGGAPLISTSTTGKQVLQAAASILAVESYHAGLIRGTIYLTDPTGSLGALQATQAVSQLRNALSQAAKPTTVPTGVIVSSPDDYGLYPGTYPSTNTVTLGSNTTGVPASNISDANPTTVVGFARTTTQVLNIVTGGNATTAGSTAKGAFFPSGLNGTFS